MYQYPLPSKLYLHVNIDAILILMFLLNMDHVVSQLNY